MSKTKKQIIKDLIAKHESGGDYNVVYGGEKEPLTSMTLGDVLNWQKEQKKEGAKSTAAGKYQVIHKTLADIVRRNPKDMPLDRPFDEATQEEIADILLERRGWSDFEAGKLSDKEMAKELAKEWASLPDPETGKSFYEKDGLNKSHHSVKDVMNALNIVETSSVKKSEQRAAELAQAEELTRKWGAAVADQDLEGSMTQEELDAALMQSMPSRPEELAPISPFRPAGRRTVSF